MFRLAVTLVAGAFLASACSQTGIEESGGNKDALGGFSSETGRYVIVFEDAPVPTYDGSTAGFTATRTDGQRLQANDSSVTAYRSYLTGSQRTMLSDLSRRWGSIEVDRTFQLAVNGAAVKMSEKTAAGVAQAPGVKAIYPDETVYPTTASSIQLIGAENVHLGINQDSAYLGEGMVVGIIDSGLNPNHPSFAATGDDGYTVRAPEGLSGYLGDCVESPELCNDKLIGMYNFAGEDPVNDVEDQVYSIDTSGHGSHVAATAAGNVLFDTPLLDAEGNPLDLSYNQISGVAPHANIINYKVCTVGCSVAAIVGAVEQAIEDGVDALNHSISSGAGSPWNSAQGLAFLNARAAGIFVANSAGNSGSAPGTAEAGGNAPWAAAVAASSHDRAFTEKTIGGFSGGASSLNGVLVGRSISGAVGAPIVYAGNYSNGVDEEPEQCLVPFPEGTFNGEIVVCDRGQIARVAKGINVRDGGAGGFVLVNLEGAAATVNDDPHVLPAIHLDAADGAVLKGWLAEGSDHFANISGGVSVARDPALADVVIGFSSRGPYTGFDILAPNIAAPGVAIFAAGAGLTAAQVAWMQENLDDRSQASVPGAFGEISGTSMASPHIAGAALLVKQAHPEWTDAEVLSAMQSTATRGNMQADFGPGGVLPATPFDRGTGRIQVDAAINAGLIMDETPDAFFAANPAEGGDPRTLNIPALVDDNCEDTCTFSRSVRAVNGGAWTVQGDASWISASPVAFALAAGETQVVTVTVDATQMEPGFFQFGEVVLTPDEAGVPDTHMTVVTRTLLQAPTVTEEINDFVDTEGENRYGPFSVMPSTMFTVEMTGDGDADLYVRFGDEPTVTEFDCRPFTDGSNERCELVVPAGIGTASIMVQGFAAANYTLRITYSPTSTDDGVSETLNGEVDRREELVFGPYLTAPETPVLVEMRGTGDPDLHVSFGSAPTRTSFECRPYRSGAEETCEMISPATNSEMYIMVRGFRSATFQIDLTYIAP